MFIYSASMSGGLVYLWRVDFHLPIFCFLTHQASSCYAIHIFLAILYMYIMTLHRLHSFILKIKHKCDIEGLRTV